MKDLERRSIRHYPSSMTSRPWLSGPRELIVHAVAHMRLGGPFDYRIAMISIDNAVELGIKTYLSLPRRVRGRDGPTRAEIGSAGTSFPALLDLLEVHASDRVSEITLGDLEVYHRLRNALYHDGNGVTVDALHVDGYLQVARGLLGALLDLVVEEESETAPTTELGSFIETWGDLEARLRYNARCVQDVPESISLRRAAEILVAERILPADFLPRLQTLVPARNAIVHGIGRQSPQDLETLQVQLAVLLAQVPEAGC